MHHSELNFPSLRFQKKASEIKAAVTARRTALEGKQQTLRKMVSEICARRDISPDEVYAAGDNQAAISAYTGKIQGILETNAMSNNVKLSSGVIQALQDDINQLSELGRKHARRANVLADLKRVQENLGDDNRLFDLQYSELATLGF